MVSKSSGCYGSLPVVIIIVIVASLTCCVVSLLSGCYSRFFWNRNKDKGKGRYRTGIGERYRYKEEEEKGKQDVVLIKEKGSSSSSSVIGRLESDQETCSPEMSDVEFIAGNENEDVSNSASERL